MPEEQQESAEERTPQAEEPEETESTPAAEAAVTEAAAAAIAETESPAESTTFQKSAEERAAEEAMLAELERSMSQDDEEEVIAVQPSDESGVSGPANLNLLLDVNLLVTVELGRKEMSFAEVLQLSKGSLVELSKIADEPVDIYVNQSKIAEGEVVVVDDHFGVRVTKLLSESKMKSFA